MIYEVKDVLDVMWPEIVALIIKLLHRDLQLYVLRNRLVRSKQVLHSVDTLHMCYHHIGLAMLII